MPRLDSTGPGSKAWLASQEAARHIALMKRELEHAGKSSQFDAWLTIVCREGTHGELNDDGSVLEI